MSVMLLSRESLHQAAILKPERSCRDLFVVSAFMAHDSRIVDLSEKHTNNNNMRPHGRHGINPETADCRRHGTRFIDTSSGKDGLTGQSVCIRALRTLYLVSKLHTEPMLLYAGCHLYLTAARLHANGWRPYISAIVS